MALPMTPTSFTVLTRASVSAVSRLPSVNVSISNTIPAGSEPAPVNSVSLSTSPTQPCVLHSSTRRIPNGNSRILPLALGGRQTRRPAFPVEREDAFRQDFHRLSASEEAWGQTCARGDIQACGGGCGADGP